jgi:hypothetical protein
MRCRSVLGIFQHVKQHLGRTTGGGSQLRTFIEQFQGLTTILIGLNLMVQAA